MEHFLGIFLAAALTGDNDRTGIQLLPADARPSVFLIYQLPQLLAVHQGMSFEGRKAHRTFEKDLAITDLHLRHTEPGRVVLYCQP